jgi:hypothetical protein
MVSNHLAIATVTAAFESVVRDAMLTVVPRADVRSGSGAPDPAFVGAQLFLYRVAPNSSVRNQTLPTRDSGGRLIQRGRFPADLEYLLTFFGGTNAGYEAQALLGRVITTLVSEPVLTAERIRTTIANKAPALDGSDLAAATESVRLVPLTLDPDQLVRLWSGIYQAPYVLSVAYAASVVWLEPEETPPVALP